MLASIGIQRRKYWCYCSLDDRGASTGWNANVVISERLAFQYHAKLLLHSRVSVKSWNFPTSDLSTRSWFARSQGACQHRVVGHKSSLQVERIRQNHPMFQPLFKKFFLQTHSCNFNLFLVKLTKSDRKISSHKTHLVCSVRFYLNAPTPVSFFETY